jgi:hypothetical protein
MIAAFRPSATIRSPASRDVPTGYNSGFRMLPGFIDLAGCRRASWQSHVGMQVGTVRIDPVSVPSTADIRRILSIFTDCF